jgi:hypothetical protein
VHRYRQLLQFLRPYLPIFLAALAAAVVSSVMEGFTFVLIIPFLRTVFGNSTALPLVGGNAVEEGEGLPRAAGDAWERGLLADGGPNHQVVGHHADAQRGQREPHPKGDDDRGMAVAEEPVAEAVEAGVWDGRHDPMRGKGEAPAEPSSGVRQLGRSLALPVEGTATSSSG